jgi:pimeloyl-ACP methyl ester carboxylesterase
MTHEFVVERSAQRRIQVRHEGRSDDPLVVYLHGSPSSRIDIGYAGDRNGDLGVHVAAFDRPGYGGSDYHRFTLASVADDAVAVAERSGITDLGCSTFRREALRQSQPLRFTPTA